VLTTDGTTEARQQGTQEFFGESGLAQAIETLVVSDKPLEGIAKQIIARAKKFAGEVLGDDACMVVARFLGTGENE